MNTALLISSFLIGIGGSLHCLGMCGPLALAVPFSGENGLKKYTRIGLYFLAKALAYGSIGSVLGLLGMGVALMEWQQFLSVIAGVIVLLIALLPVLKPRVGGFIFQKKYASTYQKLQQSPKWYYYFLLGFFNGFLPCGLVYVALAAAVATGSWIDGFWAMFLFGIGTAPLLVMLVVFKNKINPQWSRKLKPVSVVLTVGLGILLILRGMNLGIPYISPEVNVETRTVGACCTVKK